MKDLQLNQQNINFFLYSTYIKDQQYNAQDSFCRKQKSFGLEDAFDNVYHANKIRKNDVNRVERVRQHINDIILVEQVVGAFEQFKKQIKFMDGVIKNQKLLPDNVARPLLISLYPLVKTKGQCLIRNLGRRLP